MINDEPTIKAKKRMDQHFLKDKNILGIILKIADVKKGDVVLEVGPGLGILTNELLDKAKKVVAIEKDKEIIAYLKKNIKKRNLQLIEGDALKVKFPAFDKCVSNIPYSISSHLILKLGQLKKEAVLMLQKEFAERMVAKPGTKDYSRLSVMAQYYFFVSIEKEVSKGCFYPAPKVDSAIVKLTPLRPKLKKEEEEFFFIVVRSLFNHKNQKVGNALIHSRHEFGWSKEEVKKTAKNIKYKDEKVYELDLNKLIGISREISKELKK